MKCLINNYFRDLIDRQYCEMIQFFSTGHIDQRGNLICKIMLQLIRSFTASAAAESILHGFDSASRIGKAYPPTVLIVALK